MSKEFSALGKESKKKRVILEQSGCCLICGLNEWMGRSIPLQLDHISGNRKDESRENLRAICPNCHSQTITYCGRNIKSSLGEVKRISDEEIKKALNEHATMAQAIRSLGKKPTPHFYERCRSLRAY